MKPKTKKRNPLHGTNGQLMVMAAHRYSLGRRSYIVGSCIEWLKVWWDEFEVNTKFVIVRDTVEALQDDLAGDDMDKRGWLEFGNWAYNGLDEESKRWVKSAVAHRRKDWPLTVGIAE